MNKKAKYKKTARVVANPSHQIDQAIPAEATMNDTDHEKKTPWYKEEVKNKKSTGSTLT